MRPSQSDATDDARGDNNPAPTEAESARAAPDRGRPPVALTHDAFICHATEDKEGFVRPLARALAESHVRVWYDEYSLAVGDSLRRTIERGLSCSKFGIVILSHNFFSKHWPQEELNGLAAREAESGKKVILPVWVGLERADVLQHSPILADRVAVKSSQGVRHVCEELTKVIRPIESPLVVAQEYLASRGIFAAPVTDEWWLDLLEISAHTALQGGFTIPDGLWGARWCFPIPIEGETGAARGRYLAWVALMRNWIDDAYDRRICQLTRPDEVQQFISAHPGLAEVCGWHPEYLACYAPQLTIPGFAGAFEQVFVEYLRSHSGDRNLFALSAPDYFGVDGPLLACTFVQGDFLGPPVDSFFSAFDNAVWLLSGRSDWLPAATKEILLEGIRQWGVWVKPTADDEDEPHADAFWHKMSTKRKNRSLGQDRSALTALERRVRRAAQRLRLAEPPEILLERFLNSGLIESYPPQRR